VFNGQNVLTIFNYFPKCLEKVLSLNRDQISRSC
jgi:hypothetical protein